MASEEPAIHGKPRCLYCIPAVGELLRQHLLRQSFKEGSSEGVEEDSSGRSRQEVASAMIQMLEGSPSAAADNQPKSDPFADIGDIPISQQQALEEVSFFHPSPVAEGTQPGSAMVSLTDYFATLPPISRCPRYEAWPATRHMIV